MIKQIVSASMGVAVWAAMAAEGVSPRPELLASVEFASFSAFQQKVVDLGTTINNPVVSMMAVPSVQNALTEKFGKFRQDETVLLLCYADMAALRKTMAADLGEAADALDAVLLYPSAEGPKEFIDSHLEKTGCPPRAQIPRRRRIPTARLSWRTASSPSTPRTVASAPLARTRPLRSRRLRPPRPPRRRDSRWFVWT